MNFPLWATPQRRAYLVALFLNSKGFCVYGEGQDCPAIRAIRLNPFKPVPKRYLYHLYEFHSERLIDWWKEDDRDMRSILWRLEKKCLHAAPHKHFPQIRTRAWDSITREQHFANAPVFRIVAVGVSAFTQGRIAKVSIPSLKKALWVDLCDIQMPSKNQCRKFARYGKGLAPKNLTDQIDERVCKAVAQYLR